MKTIIIIGGSKGIGHEILKSQLELGNHVINISRSDLSIEHENLTSFNCDILEDDLPEIEKADTLIYCPGSINLKPINSLSLEDFKSDFQINVLGAVKFIKKYLSLLKSSDSGSILLFSTVAAKLGMPYHASVAASKAAIEGLTKSLGAELAPSVRVNAIAPTVTDTSLASKILRSEKIKDNLIEKHPLKKILSPSDVAGLADYLISDKASSVSGQIIQLDSGIVTFKI